MMIKNNLAIAWRTLSKNPKYALLNLAGLAIGITACLLIVLFISHERSFDRFHAKNDRIFRVNYDILMGGKQTISPSVPVFVAPHLTKLFPEIERAVRFSNEWRPRTMRRGEVMFDETGFCYSDSGFFKVFDFQVLQGNADAALARPGALVLTKSMAKKYFGDENPLGQTLNFNNRKDYEVAAVVADVPGNSHFSFNFLVSHLNTEGFSESEKHVQWNNPNYATWLLLRPGTNPKALSEKIENWVNPPEQVAAGQSQNNLHLPLEPLTEAHFNTVAVNFGNYLAITDARHLGIFGAIAVLILLIACINYVNMATARASTRAQEVGIRKAVGAQFGQLVWQFLSESFLLLLPAFLISVGLVSLFLPKLNDLLDKTLPFRLLEWPFVAGLALAWLTLSLAAGFYPAVMLSRFRPMATLKGNFSQPRGGGLGLRQGLVVFQFAISTMLIVGTIVVREQLNFVQNKAIGLDQDQAFIMRGNVDLLDKIGPFCEQLRGLSVVESVARTWRSPFETVVGNGFSLKSNPTDGSDWHMVGGIAADNHYLQTLGIQLISGRNFDPAKFGKDSTAVNEFMVNEAFLRHYNLKPEEAIGLQPILGLVSQRGLGTIVGVVRDFHTQSLHDEVEPIVIFNDPSYCVSPMVRVRAGQKMSDVMAQVEAVWKSVVPTRPFNFTFLDAQYDAMYRTERRMGSLMAIFSAFAVLVACLGLLGLVAFMVSQRTKEIGIRKVLGASVASISNLLVRDFVKLVIAAIFIASPIAYFFMKNWLNDFAYRIEMQWWMFAAAGFLAIAIAFLTVGFQAVRVALADPIKSLRSE